MSLVTVTLNGIPVQADTGQTILEVARRSGITIPTLCHDLRLKPFGSCRVCLVKVEGARNFVPSCSTSVTDGMIIDTEDREVVEARRLSLALLISDHYGDCVAPCSLECPAHIDIQGYIALIRAGQYQEAVKLIKERNPMPVTIGRICPHPCEEVCRRSRVDEPIAINNLKRFAADYDIALDHPWVPDREAPKNKKVAVIGAGPAGLSAAWYLTAWGYEVTIYERWPKAGGMLRYGIPEYRLPKDILDREIELVQKLGAEILYDTLFGRDVTLASLRADGYEAVFLGIGAQRSTDMRIEGERLPGVLSGIDFLADMASGRRRDLLGKTVIVVGGGNTAMDASRTSLRLGAGKVVVLYRRTRNEMPAHDFEIREAEEEGIEFQFLAAPIRISRDGERLLIECIRMELGPPDESGRRRPVPVPGSNHTVPADLLITAVGQQPDVSCIDDPGLVGARDRIKADPQTGATDMDFVFAGGDCVSGAATAIEAIAAGRRAALSMDRYIQNGDKPVSEREEFNISKGKLEEIPEEFFELYQKSPRVKMPALQPSVRIRNFMQIEEGLSEDAAMHETTRCLECGCIEGFTCSLRAHSTDYRVAADPFPGMKNRYPELNNMLSDHPPIVRDENKCVKCGLCVRICDEVWGLSVFGYVNRGFETEITPSFGLSLDKTACDYCGQCADACPTGALALNPYIPKPGPLAMVKKRGICVLCSLGCEVDFNIYGNTILQCTAEPGIGENEGNLCVRGRFGYRHLLPANRCTEYLEIRGDKRVPLLTDTAVQRAAGMLKKRGSKVIFTSTSLSNEEYDQIHDLSRKIGADIYHVSHDPAENGCERHAVFGSVVKSRNAPNILHPSSKLIRDLPAPDLSALSRAGSIVLFNISPGRSFPILEMKLRQAAERGVRLFVIHHKPTRLDDRAESVFRINEALFGDFLKLTGLLGVSRSGRAPEEVKTYFRSLNVRKDLLAKVRIKPAKITAFVQALDERTIYITDGDSTDPEDLQTFVMLALIQRGSSQLLCMRRGTNPVGAEKRAKGIEQSPEIIGELSGRYDTLVLYKLPELFNPEGKQVVHVGYAPFDRYVPEAVFIPSSSLLETGGTTHLYNGKKVELQPILRNDRGLDNVGILARISKRI